MDFKLILSKAQYLKICGEKSHFTYNNANEAPNQVLAILARNFKHWKTSRYVQINLILARNSKIGKKYKLAGKKHFGAKIQILKTSRKVHSNKSNFGVKFKIR